MWWSPDSRYLCYATFNDSKVPLFRFPYYGPRSDLYGEIIEFAYPKVGIRNWLSGRTHRRRIYSTTSCSYQRAYELRGDFVRRRRIGAPVSVTLLSLMEVAWSCRKSVSYLAAISLSWVWLMANVNASDIYSPLSLQQPRLTMAIYLCIKYFLFMANAQLLLASPLVWSYKTCKAPVKSSQPTNHHPVFYRPDTLPVAQPTASEHCRKKYHILWN